MQCDDAKLLLPEYALGVLTEEERASVTEHIEDPLAAGGSSGCPACRRELAQWLETIAYLAEEPEAVQPPAELKEALLARMASTPQRSVGTIATKSSDAAAPWGEDLLTPRPALASSPLSARTAAWSRYLPHIAAALVTVVLGSMLARLGRDTQVASPARPADDQTANQQPGDAEANAWRRQIDQTDRALGLRGARLVSVESTPVAFSPTGPAVRSHLLYDELSEQLHLLITGIKGQTPEQSTWAWAIERKGAIDREGAVVTGTELHAMSAAYSAAVLDLPQDQYGAVELVVTLETDAEPVAPSNSVLGRIELK